jgi:hypothetical protein
LVLVSLVPDRQRGHSLKSKDGQIVSFPPADPKARAIPLSNCFRLD